MSFNFVTDLIEVKVVAQQAQGELIPADPRSNILPAASALDHRAEVSKKGISLLMAIAPVETRQVVNIEQDERNVGIRVVREPRRQLTVIREGSQSVHAANTRRPGAEPNSCRARPRRSAVAVAGG